MELCEIWIYAHGGFGWTRNIPCDQPVAILYESHGFLGSDRSRNRVRIIGRIVHSYLDYFIMEVHNSSYVAFAWIPRNKVIKNMSEDFHED